MSVPKGQQSDGKLLVNELARDLLARMDKFYSDLWRVEHEKHF